MSVGDEITTTAAGDEPLALINQLADEILGAIFLINTAKATYYNPHSTTLATAQVCSRWRAVALSYSALWSKIIDYERHPPTWIEELLRRSGSSLIDVGEDSVFKPVELQNPRAMEVLQPVFGQSSRLRTFSLKIRLAPWEFICQNLLRHPAPQLKYLNLITVCPFPDCLYPGPLFSAEAPALRSLHLQRCLIDFSSVVLSNLTELSVMDILAPPLLTGRGNNHPLKIAPTAVGWLRVLENMPSLRYLTLGDAISDNSNAKFDEALPKVHLPNLVLLTISSRFHEGTSLFDHLTIPSLCGIRFRLSGINHGSDSSSILSILSKQLAHWPQDVSDRYIQAKILTGNRIHFGNSRRIGHVWNVTESEVVHDHALSSRDPLLWLIFMFDSSEDALEYFNLLLALYDSSFSTTTALDLWLDDEFASKTASGASFPSLHTLHSFTTVKNLSLIERSPLYLLPLFKYSSLPNRPLFPAMTSLCLTGIAMEDCHCPAYCTIIAFLLWRAEIRVPLTDLHIIRSRTSPSAEVSLARTGNVCIASYVTNSTITLSEDPFDYWR